ncbi:hypothetical protein [Aquimarina sp. AU474]|uniref:hypothetical protein n=1 Tax=Aquimarina sp. AU474 TaxID=2108529 RepID=UPI000D68A47A|nr:hypothetical protein [Aquimarina sp. AU474]
MKNLILLLLTTSFFCSSCNNDDDNDELVTSQEFIIKELNNSGINGTATFEKFSSGQIIVSLTLSGTESEKSYTANIYNNSITEDGDIAISVGAINGEFGTGAHIISNLDYQDPNTPATPITYEELIQFDGHIKILNNDNESIIIAAGNIGSNAK